MADLTCKNCYFFNDGYCDTHQQKVDPKMPGCPEHSGFPWFKKYDDGSLDDDSSLEDLIEGSLATQHLLERG